MSVALRVQNMISWTIDVSVSAVVQTILVLVAVWLGTRHTSQKIDSLGDVIVKLLVSCASRLKP